MPRPPKWNAPTESVRLPKHAIAACLELAAALDSPMPSPAVDEQFQEYLSFVRNLVEPKLWTIDDGVDRRQYLTQGEPISFEEYQLVCEVEAKFLAECDRLGLSQCDRLYAISQMVEEICKPM